MLELRDVSVRDLRSFITERGFSHAGLLERHELEARAEEAAAAQASRPPPAAAGATASPQRSLSSERRPQGDQAARAPPASSIRSMILIMIESVMCEIIGECDVGTVM